MCGITGYYSASKHKFTQEDLKRMTDSLKHRGPDAEGFFTDEYVGLGHRRLSIIDLSERANQPMFSHGGRYVVIYNGEVYNFREIGARLKTTTSPQGTINFKTSSDTEVIIEAFAHYGTSFVNHLNGMFAIAIYDKEKNELFLFRDRLGIKPLYYFWDGTTFAFASELKALTKLDIPLVINKNAIRDFLHLGYIPTPASIYKQIHKMPSGSIIKISEDGIDIQKYWNIKNKIHSEVISDKQQAMVKLSDLIISSVQYQLKSDVPFGVFLSGGIDSSLITAQAVELSSVKVNTFSIGFEENIYNESQYAKAVARYLGTDHYEFIVSYNDAINLIEDVFEAYDEPFADSSAFPTMLVSKLAKNQVTVTLSGEGGDELFFGYGAYKWSQRLHNPVFKYFRKPIAELLYMLPSRYQRAGHMFDFSKESNLYSHIFSQEQYMFSDQELDSLLQPAYAAASTIQDHMFNTHVNRSFNEFERNGRFVGKERILNPMESQALFDLLYYLQDDLLTKVDRASMQHSIETRVPYLDHRVVEFALNLSPSLKYKDGVSKYILKEILYQYIPKKFFDRPKQGFAIPLLVWLQNQLKYLIDQYLSKEMIEKYNVVKYEEVATLKIRFFGGVDYLYNRIWLLIVLHKWLEHHGKSIEFPTE